jgi:hypothetical protein
MHELASTTHLGLKCVGHVIATICPWLRITHGC